MPVITISRELGSGGSEIAAALVEKTQGGFLDKQGLEGQLEEHGFPTACVERYDQKKPGFWDRLSVNGDHYLHFLRTAILETAQEGNCVILGRGGQFILKDVPGVLHTRTIASRNTRLKRLRKRCDCGEHNAKKLLQRSDQNRSGFHKFFFHSDWESPAHYDVVLNTDRQTVQSSADLILEMANHPLIAGQRQQMARVLANLNLEQAVKTAILLKTSVSPFYLDVEADQGVVTLRGTVVAAQTLTLCESLASEVEGVDKVVNQLVHNPYPHGIL